MPGRKPHTSRLLIFIVFLLCLICSCILTQSSAGRIPGHHISLVADTSDKASSDPSSDTVDVVESTSTPKPTQAASTPKKTAYQVSPEAKEGSWTADGSHWLFMVNGQSYTGWLTDTDGHRYYFDESGVMQTGWVTIDKKTYYLDLDGIMQTGTITVNGEKYKLDSSGVLKSSPPAQN